MDEQLSSNKQRWNDHCSKSEYTVPSEVQIYDRSESDATHPLLRTDQHPAKFVLCLTCRKHIPNNSFSDICAHYLLYPHLHSFSKCLYCNGNVHHYLHPTKVQPEVFHYCSPRK